MGTLTSSIYISLYAITPVRAEDKCSKHGWPIKHQHMDNSTAARPSGNCLWMLTQDSLGLTVPVGHCCKLFPVYFD